jgi:hypothetical protein
MPNHIQNRLFLKGNKESIDKIISNEFQFNNTIPIPENEDKNWYNWNIENWGTKWDAYDVEIKKRNDNYAIIEFLTAWAPPYMWLKNMSQILVDIQYKLVWADEDFPSSGKITNNYDKEYANENPHAISFVKKHFIDYHSYWFDDKPEELKETFNIDINDIKFYDSDDDILEDDILDENNIEFVSLSINKDDIVDL